MRPTRDLDSFKDELKALQDAGATIPALTAHLRSRGVSIGRSTLWRRCKEWGWAGDVPARIRLPPRESEAATQLEARISALFHERRSDQEIVDVLAREAREAGTVSAVGSLRALRRLRKEKGMRHRKFNGEGKEKEGKLDGADEASTTAAAYVKEKRQLRSKDGKGDEPKPLRKRGKRLVTTTTEKVTQPDEEESNADVPVDPRLQQNDAALIRQLLEAAGYEGAGDGYTDQRLNVTE